MQFIFNEMLLLLNEIDDAFLQVAAFSVTLWFSLLPLLYKFIGKKFDPIIKKKFPYSTVFQFNMYYRASFYTLAITTQDTFLSDKEKYFAEFGDYNFKNNSNLLQKVLSAAFVYFSLITIIFGFSGAVLYFVIIISGFCDVILSIFI